MDALERVLEEYGRAMVRIDQQKVTIESQRSRLQVMISELEMVRRGRAAAQRQASDTRAELQRERTRNRDSVDIGTGIFSIDGRPFTIQALREMIRDAERGGRRALENRLENAEHDLRSIEETASSANARARKLDSIERTQTRHLPRRGTRNLFGL